MRTGEKFEALFSRATGHEPYPYQSRIGAASLLPDAIDVPTGCGKTAAIVIAWLWRLLEAPNDIRRATPRRLVLALPFRSLADQTELAVRGWIERLDVDVDVHVVMGGRMQESRSWRESPERISILIGTIDTITSKALCRGYGVPRANFPMDFAQVVNDCHLVVDEIQAAPETTTTLRQVAAFLRTRPTVGPTGLTCMSATLHRSLLDTVDNPFTEGDQVVTIEDTDDDSHLRRRLDTRRTIASLAADVAKPRDIATAVAARHVAGSLTLVIVNTVKTAVAVYRALLKIGPAADVTLLHSRFRPIERGAIMAEVLAPPNTSGRIVVATQVIEAGADLDAATLISEVAPWPSMVQRAGRLNRAGLRDAATLWWLPAPKQTAPYDADVIAQSEHALRALEGESVTSRELLAAGPPEKPASVRVLRRIDFDSLFDTTPDLTGNDLDIAPYVRDTADELDVQVFWGNWDRTPPDAMRAPAHDYRCRAPITAVRELIKRARVWRFDQVAASWQPVGAIRPGDVLAVAARDGGYRPDIGFDPASLAPVITLDVPADAQAREDAFADDARSVGSSRWITLDQHLCETEAEAKKLVMTLRLTEDEKADVVLAARLHDCGKAHPAWQQAIRTTATDDLPVPDSGLPYAKSPNGRSRLRFDKGVTNFRHELAGLTMLDGPLQSLLNTARDRDLVRYLVLAHHGRVRVQARNPTNDTSGRLLGLLDGESAELPDILGVAGVTYAPVLAAFLGNGIGASWSDTVDGLLERFGGARLAFLETIVRVADWRASALHDVTNEVRS